MATSILERIERFELPATSNGTTYQVSVLQPNGEHADGSLPILFVLDADNYFGTIAETFSYSNDFGAVRPATIVGIGYGAATLDMVKLRTPDLTPALEETNAEPVDRIKALVGDERGGADRFLSFLLDELAPEIAKRYPSASPARPMIFGHSLAGLFVIHALMTRPEAFSTFLAASPSLWWDDFSILQRLPELSAKLDVAREKPAVFLCAGALEQVPPKRLPASLALPGIDLETLQAMTLASRMVDAPRDLVQPLLEAGVERCLFTAFDEEGHSSVVPAAISRSLAFALSIDD